LIVAVVVFAVIVVLATIEAIGQRRKLTRRREAVAARVDAAPTTAAPPAISSSWREGASLEGGYQIKRRLGSGSFGDVFLVEHRALQRSWAAKVLRRELADDPARRQALLAELAYGFAVAGHPNIVEVKMFRSFGDELAIFSELVEGGTLADRLADPAWWRLDRLLEIALQLAWALEAIHTAGLVHGDVKPANILLTRDGAAKLADLGLTSQASGARRGVHGTRLYRSPEQAKGVSYDRATDIWSWAVTVIAMVLGEQPSHAGGEVAMYTLAALRANPSEGRVRLEGQLANVLAACLRKPPAERPAAPTVARQLSAELLRITGRVCPRPVATPVPVERHQLATELAAHAEALRRVISRIDNSPARQDGVLHVALGKSECHRRSHDLAGVVATLEQVVAVTPQASAPLRATAWLELAQAHQMRGDVAAASHAFETAAACSTDLLLRGRAYHGRALAAWLQGDRNALAIMSDAEMLAAQAGRDPLARPEAQLLRATSLLVLADMLRETGDREGAAACARHVLDTVVPDDPATKPLIARAWLAVGKLDCARAVAAGSHEAVLSATVDLDDALAQVARGRPDDGLVRAGRALDRVRPLAEAGDEPAILAFAVAEIYVVWLRRRVTGEPPPSEQLERALSVIDGYASHGRADAAALARWAREELASP
jgi:tRNA A-37 threonylcarbamoyl transferase component Bud32